MKLLPASLLALFLIVTPSTLAVAQGKTGPLACGGKMVGFTIEVTKHNAECIWPFVADSVKIVCDSLGERFGRVFVEAGGKRYGLNGLGAQRYGELEPIWLDDEQYPGLKVNVGPWIDIGLSLCR